jgi:hypothetical protein
MAVAGQVRKDVFKETNNHTQGRTGSNPHKPYRLRLGGDNPGAKGIAGTLKGKNK